MTSKTKTGDKLVASIRKSKTGSVANKTAEPPVATESADKPKRATVKSESTARPAATVASSKDRENSYSHGRRVWPD